MRRFIASCLTGIAILCSVACPAKKEGVVKGQILPPGPNIRIAALDQGKTIAQAEADPREGRFSLTLPAGAYDIRITTPASPFPLSITGVSVKSGETTALAPMVLTPSEGTGRIAGKALAAAAGARVTLFAEGIERASVTTAADGRYEFERLPGGTYTLQVEAPGYAKDSRLITVSDDRRISLDMRLLYVTAIEGVDWNTGKVRSRGVGLPPKQDMPPTARREMAKRAALLDAERNMIRVLELIKTAPDQRLSEVLGEGSMTQVLSGFLKGYRVAAERDMDGGRIEIEIELPLTGLEGLSSLIRP